MYSLLANLPRAFRSPVRHLQSVACTHRVRSFGIWSWTAGMGLLPRSCSALRQRHALPTRDRASWSLGRRIAFQCDPRTVREAAGE